MTSSNDAAGTPDRVGRSVGSDVHSPDIFAHFVVQTSQYETVRDWYRTLLNAEIVHEKGGLCFMTYDDEHHRLAVKHVPNLSRKTPDIAGVTHFAYAYADLGKLLSTYRRLKAGGITPYWSINHGPTTSMYYRDPDGLEIELQVDNFATKEEVSEFFASPEFSSNPIGVKFDPEELIKSYEAGTPDAELKKRPQLPQGMTPADMRP